MIYNAAETSSPVISTDPQSQAVSLGSPAMFSAAAVGQGQIGYQWRFNGNPISDATNTSYSIGSVETNQAGGYSIVATNSFGSATSAVATLTVIVAPLIVTDPVSLTVRTGSTAGFTATAIGAPTLGFQWQFNGTNIDGALASAYSIPSAQVGDEGLYSVIVSNYAGSVTSAPASLTVYSGSANGVVISQVYGGGGNTGATYRNDYVELFNAGGAAVNLSTWSVQYASATGSTWSKANLTGSVQPGQYFLLQLASGGSVGIVLPTANATNTGINLGASAGKVALLTNQTLLTGSNPLGSTAIADFVGYGTTCSAYEGTGAAPAGSASSAILRNKNGVTDTGDNAADFTAGTPNPRSSITTGGTIDLAITATHAGNFTRGESADVYTIKVSNAGTLASTGTVTVVESLPAGLTAAALSGTGWTANLGTLTCTRTDALASGSTFPPITLTVSVPADAPSLVTNWVSVSTGGDANAANDAASDITTIVTSGGGGGGIVYTGILAGWDVLGLSGFGASPLVPGTNAMNVTVVGLTRGAGVTTTPSASADAWGGNGFTSTSAAAAITAGDFATFSVAASAGYTLSLSSIARFDYRRSSSGPPNGVMQYQVGTGEFVSFATNAYATSSSGNSLSPMDLSGIAALQNVGPGTNVTFRIVNYGATSSTGTWYIWNVAKATPWDLTVVGVVTPLNGPTAAAPVLSLPTLVNNQLQFTLSGTAGSNYIVEAAPGFPAGAWMPVQTSSAPILFVCPATNGQQYFRARVQP